MLYVYIRDVMDGMLSVCIMRCGAVESRCSCIGSVSVSSCR